MQNTTIIILLILLSCSVIAEEKIISGTVETTTQNGRATIKTTIEGTASTQELDCHANNTMTYPVQIKKDLTCTSGTVEKCDEKFSNLTDFMNTFSNAYNHTISQDFSDCQYARESNTRNAVSMIWLNQSFTDCDATKSNLTSENQRLLDDNKLCLKDLSTCTGRPKDCSEENKKISDDWDKRRWYYFATGLGLGSAALWFFYYRKENAMTPGGRLPPR